MSASALPSFLSAVITALRADSDLSAVRIFDGIEIDQSYPGDAVAIGHDGSMEGDDTASSQIRQEYIQLGAKQKFEDGLVSCSLWSWDGLTDLAARRTRAFALLSRIETVIRNDVSFGGVVLYSGLDAAQLNYRQTNVGAAVVINFTISYRARI